MLEAYQVIENNLPKYSLLTSLIDKVNLATQHLRSCNAGRNYMAFDTIGNISKCHMLMENPITNILRHSGLEFRVSQTLRLSSIMYSIT